MISKQLDEVSLVVFIVEGWTRRNFDPHNGCAVVERRRFLSPPIEPIQRQDDSRWISILVLGLKVTLNLTRCRTGDQCSLRNTGMIWSRHRHNRCRSMSWSTLFSAADVSSRPSNVTPLIYSREAIRQDAQYCSLH